MTIFVAGFRDSVDEQQLESLFKPFGEISALRLVRDVATGESRRYAFVEMPNRAACAAIEALRGYRLEGRKLTVQDADTDQRRHHSR